MTNRDHVAPEKIDAVIADYDRRCDIENQYLLYNLWRLTDYLIKVGLEQPIRSPPVISANTFVRALRDFLRRVD